MCFFFATDYAFFNFNSPTEQQFCLVMIYRRGKGGVDKIKLISPSTAGQGNSLTTWKAFFNNFISPRVRRVLTITLHRNEGIYQDVVFFCDVLTIAWQRSHLILSGLVVEDGTRLFNKYPFTLIDNFKLTIN